jgi:hypothetical protein
MEQRVRATVLLGNGGITCQGACRHVPLHIDNEYFQIDALMMDIRSDINIVLGMPWLEAIGRIKWDFTSREMQFQRGQRTVSFTTNRRCQASRIEPTPPVRGAPP